MMKKKICQLIVKLINWEEMGLKIAATASNGIEALEQAKICKPEILITDIRMPGIDGMELIGKVKEKTAGYRDHHNQWIQAF